MPTCQAYKGTNTTGKTTKGKNFFKTPELKNATERKRAQQWLHLIEEHLLDSICRTLCSYSHKTCSSYRYIMLCYPAQYHLLWNLPFQKHFHSLLSFYQFLPVNTRSHYCSSHEQILYLILKLSQIGIRLYLLNRYFHLTLLQFRIQVDTSILIVCLILKFQYSCFSFCFSLIFSM